jgi:proton-translocating NADH-quinone oxidoreductase chain N
VLSLLILLPLFMVAILNLPLRIMMKRLAFWLAAILCFYQLLLVALHPLVFWSVTPDPLGPFFSFKLALDPLTLVMLFSIAIVCFIALLVGRYTITDENSRFNFINLVLILLIGMNATVMTTDIFSLYVFMEVTAVASFTLIAKRKDILALEGAFKYIILSSVATVLMLTSVALFVLVSGGTTFSAIYGSFSVPANGFLLKLGVGLFLCGLFIKSGIVPFHGWLPDAYSAAPAAVSTLLAGIVTKVSGVYVLIRLVISVFGVSAPIQNILMFTGAASIIIGAIAALGQNDFKRMLAYSSISQVGYIILALGVASPLALAGAVFHLFNHAIFKSLLFVNAASLEERLGTTDMDKLGGLSARMPVTGATSVIALLSTAGIPPLSGFWSKLIIFLALCNAGHFYYAAIALLASVITLAYFLSMQRRVFFGILRQGLEQVKEVSAGLIVPQVLLAAIIIGVGLFFPVILNTFILPIGDLLR